MSKIEVITNGRFGTVSVDGVAVPNVTAYRIEQSVETFPQVVVELFAIEQETKIEDGILMIGSLKASEALERALLVYLQEKYPAVQPPVVEITHLGSNVRRFAEVPHRTGD